MGIRNYIRRKRNEQNTQVVCSRDLVKEPLVSVRILSRNNGAHLKQAIQSALDQKTDFDFEVVIGDDHSTDCTPHTLHHFATLYPKQVKVLKAKNKFKGSHLGNFIRTIDACRGEYIAMLDGDDYWTDKNKLADQVKYLRENYGCACCFTQAHVEDCGNDDQSLPKQYAPTRLDYSTSQILSLNFHCATSSMMFRNEIQWPAWIYKAKSDYRAIRGILAERGWFHCIQRKTCTYRANDWGVLHEMKKEKHRVIKETFRTFSKLAGYHSKHKGECRAVRDNLGEYLFRRLKKDKDLKFLKYSFPYVRHKFSAK